MTAQKMMEAVDRLTLAIATAQQELEGVSNEILSLEGTTCTGTIHWRPSGDGSAAMMYANHKHDQTCPLHGAPKEGSRLRVYIGKKPQRQQDTEKAMELHAVLQTLQRRERHLSYALNSDYRIDQFTRTLT